MSLRSGDVAAELRRLIGKLAEAKLLRDSNSVVEIPRGAGRVVSWSGSDGRAALYSSPSFGEYRRLLEERQYTLLLKDYALLQLSYEFDRHGRLVKHRLGYVPCPVTISAEELGELPVGDLLEALDREGGLDRLRLEGPLRIDYDGAAAGEAHPATHLTLLRDCCRIPVFAPLSVGHFAHFIFRHFYPADYRLHPFLGQWPLAWSARTVTEVERRGPHLEWQR